MLALLLMMLSQSHSDPRFHNHLGITYSLSVILTCRPLCFHSAGTHDLTQQRSLGSSPAVLSFEAHGQIGTQFREKRNPQIILEVPRKYLDVTRH